MNLSSNVATTIAITPTNGAAGTTDIEGVTLDMANYEGVLVLVTFGAITTGAVTSIKMQEGASDPPTADLAGTAQTIADTDDDKTFYIEVFKPLKRYLRLYVDRGTQNAVVASATYIQHTPRKMPTTNGANVSGELHVSPVAGTA